MAETVLFQRHWQRRDTAANWTSVNPILASGEWGVETNNTGATARKFKMGDGVTAWTSLPYCDPSAFVVDSIADADTTRAPSRNAVFDALALKADKAGGTFTGDISVPDEAYDATAWNGSLEVPTKNAIRDKIETLGSSGQAAIQFKDEGSALGATGSVDTVDFVGSGVVATRVGNVVTATIAGGGGGASAGYQIGYARTASTTTASDTGSSTIPGDNTKPQNTEGVAYASLDTAITPAEAASLLEVDLFIPFVSGSGATSPRFALFRDSGADAIAATILTIHGADYGYQLRLRTVVAAGSTSATTFKLRWSGQSASGQTSRLLQNSTGALLNGTMEATMTVREIKQ